MMVGYQVVYIFLVPFYQAFFQQTFYLRDFVEKMPFYIGIGNQSCRPQALQCTVADFQEFAYFVTVHPNFNFIGFAGIQMVEDVIRYGGNLVVKLLVGF